MQALGTYRGGRIFSRFGYGIGSALIVDSVLEPLNWRTFLQSAGSFEQKSARGPERLGEKKWTKKVFDMLNI